MEDTFDAAADLIPNTYLNQGKQSLKARKNAIKTLLSQRKMPEEGWDDQNVQYFLQNMALLDSNNFLGNAGVGEREGRICSKLVTERNFGLAHGIGRSGDISAVQPKAAGSSILSKTCNFLVKDAMELAGLKEVGEVLTTPVATGMAMTLVLLALMQKKPGAKIVLWPRIDQKTCAKCVIGVGLQLLPIENILEGDQLITDLPQLEENLIAKQQDILCVLTTTSCFAPRAMDKIVDISKLCKKYEIAHVINNAYGVQSEEICKEITSSWRKGRVDAIVQSTDKNFMVPVGGSIIVGKKGFSDVVKLVGKNYPGRASISPLLDVIITLLSLGRKGWKELLVQRTVLYDYLKKSLEDFASEIEERLLDTPDNPISFAMTLDKFHTSRCDSSNEKTRFLGSMLFHRCISGARVYAPGKDQTFGDLTFKNYGAHSDEYPHCYLNAAAAIGMSHQDVDTFIGRLRGCFQKLES